MENFLTKIFLVALLCVSSYGRQTKVIDLNDDNWERMLEGHWMVKFYAPWCPACKEMEDDWNGFAKWQDDYEFNCSQIDITENPALSGRFLVTSLPTIYHVKDGVFRKYRNKGSRSEKGLTKFMEDHEWLDRDPVAWYRDPTSTQMALVGQFFKLSLAIREFHQQMTTVHGVPTWVSYVLVLIATIVIGVLLGLCLVVCCDCCCPGSKAKPIRSGPRDAYKKDDGDEAAKQPEAAAADDAQEQEDEEAAEATGGDVKPAPTRKRTVQKD